MPNDTPEPKETQPDTEDMLVEYLQTLEKRISALESGKEDDIGNNTEEPEYEMNKEDALREHENLIRLLREGTPEERMAEAVKQEVELNKIRDISD